MLFIILELYPNVVTKENNKELMDLEDKYLKFIIYLIIIYLLKQVLVLGINIPEVDRQKMKDIYTDARREIIGNLNKGKNLSEETIEKMRTSALNRLSMSEETRKICVANTKPVVLYNLDRTIYGKYNTIVDAAKSYKL